VSGMGNRTNRDQLDSGCADGNQDVHNWQPGKPPFEPAVRTTSSMCGPALLLVLLAIAGFQTDRVWGLKGGWGQDQTGLERTVEAQTTHGQGVIRMASTARVSSLVSSPGPPRAPSHESPDSLPPASCQKWIVLADARHPERPGHLREETTACPNPGRLGPASLRMTHAGEKIPLRFVTPNAVTELRVTAIEDGSVGDVIRLRTMLSGSMVWGLLQADGGALLVLGSRSEDRRQQGEKLVENKSSW
jgi:hypothetical protein